MLERLPADYFADGDRLAVPDRGAVENRQRDLATLINEEVIDRTNARETTAELNLWVDPVNGSDSADGQSESRPIRTCARLAEILPMFIKHRTTVNFKEGTLDPLTLEGNVVFTSDKSTDPMFKLIGTTGKKTLTTGVNEGVASGGGRWYIDKPTGEPDWTASEMKGELLVLTGGTLAGNTYLIRDNTTTRIEIMRTGSFGTPPDNTTEFEVHDRKTLFDANGDPGRFGFGPLELIGLQTTDRSFNNEDISIQNFHMDGGGFGGFGWALILDSCLADVAVRNMLFTNKALPQSSRTNYFRMSNSAIFGPNTGFAFWSLSAAESIALFRNIFYGDVLDLSLSRVVSASIFDNEFRNEEIRYTNCGQCSLTGSIIDGVTMRFEYLMDLFLFENVIRNIPNPMRIEHVKHAQSWADDIGSSVSDAIKVVKSFLRVTDIIGTGNGGYGIRLENGAFLETSGTNTLTGTSGDIKPGALGATLWGGLPVTDPTQLVRAY